MVQEAVELLVHQPLIILKVQGLLNFSSAVILFLNYGTALARQADVASLQQIMLEVNRLESELLALGTQVSSRTIEIKARIKKSISNPRYSS